MKTIIEALTERAGIAVVVLGALVFIIGAAGGVTIQGLGLQVADWVGRVALGAIGLLVMVWGLLLLRQEQSEPIDRRSRAKYKIHIEYPTNNYIEHGDFVEISGSYKRRPPDKSLRLFVLAEDQTRYWPKCIVEQFDEDNRKWSTRVDFLKGKPGEKDDIYIVAALVGQTSTFFWDYYYRVGESSSRKVWEPWIPLPPDVVECDRIHITKQS